MRQIFVALFMLGFVWGFEGLQFSERLIKNGETLLIEYGEKEGRIPLFIEMNSKKFPFFELPFKPRYAYVLIPIAYNTPLGKKALSLHYLHNGDMKKTSVGSVEIVWGGYKKEALRVDPSKVKLSAKDQERATREYYEAKKIYAEITQTYRAWQGLQIPLNSVVTSDFGNERLFNGKRKSYHSGIDYRASTGTEVKAFGWGRVAMLSDRFYGGLMIALDHGHGIYSVYAHLSESKVKVGDDVKMGDVIALSGATGRITGPHLHFSTKVHGITVNPKQLRALLHKISSQRF